MADTADKHDVEELCPPPGLIEHLGLRIAEYPEGRADVSMTVQSHLRNRSGTLHGGVICCLLDVAIGRSIIALVGDQFRIATTNLSVTFMNACSGDEVFAHGLVLKRGRTLAHGEGTVMANGTVVAKATGTWHLSPR